MRQKIVGVTLAAGLALTGLAACGSATTTSTSQSAPAALNATANQSGVRLTVTIKGGSSAFSGGDLTAAQKQAILASSLVLTVHAANGTTLAHAGAGGDAALSLTEGGSQLAQLEVVGSKLYARVDLNKIASTYHLDGSDLAHVRGLLQEYSSQVKALGALSKGQWVSLDLGAIQSFAQAAGISLPSVPQLLAGLLTTVSHVLAQAGSSSSAASGPDQITVNVRQLVTALTQAIAANPGLSRLSPHIGDLGRKAQQAVPANKTAVVAVTVNGGKVSNLELPLGQFDAAHLRGASINVAVSGAGTITAPSGAVPVDLGQLMGVISRGMGGQSTGASGMSIGGA